jgi:rare lipoprotein A
MTTRLSHLLRILSICLLCGLIAACGSRKGGGYYKDDGPGDNPPADLDRVPDAVPKIEPLARGPNRPYTALGKSFTPDTSGRPYRMQGRASWYGRKFHGKPTSNGERYDMYGMTAAHPTLPIPSYVRVTRVSTGKTVVLRVNDRGPFLANRVIDLSYVAAYKLGVVAPGSAEVIVERIMPEEIRGWRAQAPTTAAPAATAPATPSQPTARAQTPVAMASSNIQVDTISPRGFYLQAGAFSDPARAQSMVTDLNGKVPPDLGASIKIEQSSSNLYRVRIGPFANKEAASQASERLRDNAGLSTTLSAQ